MQAWKQLTCTPDPRATLWSALYGWRPFWQGGGGGGSCWSVTGTQNNRSSSRAPPPSPQPPAQPQPQKLPARPPQGPHQGPYPCGTCLGAALSPGPALPALLPDLTRASTATNGQGVISPKRRSARIAHRRPKWAPILRLTGKQPPPAPPGPVCRISPASNAAAAGPRRRWGQRSC